MTVQHATWSLGQLVGVALGGLLSQVHYSVSLKFLLTSVAAVAIAWMVRRWLLPADVDRHEAKDGAPRVRR
jgi:predicted MFS family arabinose efflux permease